jgi:ubiquitin C-terminal hydrolase
MGQAVCCSKQQVNSSTPARFVTKPEPDSNKNSKAEEPEMTKSFVEEHELESSNYLSGIDNLGNSCYMSAALQCLIQTQEILQFIMTGRFQGDLSKNTKDSTKRSKQVLTELIRLVSKVRTQKVVRPSSFKAAVEKANDLVGFCN